MIIDRSREARKYDDGICAICQRFHVNKSSMDCGHVFCFSCLLEWCKIKLECPTCRQPFLQYRHSFEIGSTVHQIYIPDPPPAPADQPQTLEALTVNIWNERNRAFVTHPRLNDINFRTWVIDYMIRRLKLPILRVNFP